MAIIGLGTDLARSEKFTTSLKDGLDIRETLRNWHTGDLFVKVRVVLPTDLSDEAKRAAEKFLDLSEGHKK